MTYKQLIESLEKEGFSPIIEKRMTSDNEYICGVRLYSAWYVIDDVVYKLKNEYPQFKISKSKQQELIFIEKP